MADSAAIIQYRKEQISAFEEGESWLRATTVRETVIKGNQATFLVVGSNNQTADTRGINGLIPSRAANLVQSTATLTEWHHLETATGFNIFQSQGDLRMAMQENTVKVLNRRIDADIIAALDGATTNLGAAAQASLALVTRAKVKLGQNEVPTQEEDNMFAVVTPAFMGYLEQIPEFLSSDYVDVKPLSGPIRRMRRWRGFNWIEHPNLTGNGTASEKCYFYHRNAVGSAFDMEGLDLAVGYNDEQAYSYARASSFSGAVLLQQSGIVQVLHDASGIS